MALTTREIGRSEWRSFFDEFSRDLDAMLATVEVAGKDVGAQVEAERPQLTGITYDDRDDIVVIGLAAPPDGPEDLEHIVYGPLRIYMASGGDHTIVFDIEDAEARKTLLRLEPAD
jgi:hypothetical protein